MANDADRNPESAPGDWFVDKRCIDCGAARHVAPGLIVNRGDFSVFDRQPSTPEEVHQAWLAAELCPTRSVRTESHLRPPPSLYPHRLDESVYLCGHNHRSSFGAHSYFVTRPSGNLLIDSPQFTRKLLGHYEEAGGIAKILLTHRDDVADAERYASRFGARVWIHDADRDAAPYATDLISGNEATELLPGVVAVPVPGHTEGSVLFHIDGHLLFSGDSLAYDRPHDGLLAFRRACWFSWEAQTESLGRFADSGHRFDRLFCGHGWSHDADMEWFDRELRALVERMPTQ
jgi:glyoxylase-like metal-dependent hydrolase (beta-lactamase superfamily II)